jgi:NADH:ubiquinone oxidoreductase subunit
MKRLLAELFTWWNGQTMGTRFFTWRKGARVGEDAFGNVYYQDRRGERRWVIYNGIAEASAVPPEWHGWLHHTVDTPPSAQAAPERPWFRPHRANLTGTPQAYRPKGSILTPEKRPRVTGDYEPWQPE